MSRDVVHVQSDAAGNVLSFVQRLVVLPPSAYLATEIASIVCSLASVAGLFSMLIYLSKLATRVPDFGLAEKCTSVMWGFCVPQALFVAIVGVMRVGRASGAGSLAREELVGVGCIAILAGICMTIYLIRFIFLLLSLRLRFKEQTDLARQSWAARWV